MGYATGVSESVHHLARYRLRQGGVILESTVLFVPIWMEIQHKSNNIKYVQSLRHLQWALNGDFKKSKFFDVKNMGQPYWPPQLLSNQNMDWKLTENCIHFVHFVVLAWASINLIRWNQWFCLLNLILLLLLLVFSPQLCNNCLKGNCETDLLNLSISM